MWGAPRDGRPRASGEVGDSVPFSPGRRGLKPPEAPPRLPDRRRLTAEEPTLQPAGPGTRRSASCPPLAAVRRVAAGKGHRVAAQTRRRRGARREAGGARPHVSPANEGRRGKAGVCRGALGAGGFGRNSEASPGATWGGRPSADRAAVSSVFARRGSFQHRGEEGALCTSPSGALSQRHSGPPRPRTGRRGSQIW